MRHTMATCMAGLVCAAGVAWGATASAQWGTQEQGYTPSLGAPSSAFELKLGAMYTQGFGFIRPNQSLPDTAGAGIAGDLGLDYRATPFWSVGLQGEYQEFMSQAQDSAARGLTGNIGVTYHAAPYSHGDPWLRLAAGYRLFWQVNPPAGASTQLIHGFELGKATIGYDIRPTSGIALAPEVGADLTLFLWDLQNGNNTALSSAQVGTFIFAGISGRFDAGPTTRPVVATATNP